jgi:hypothetical protein
LAYAGWPARTTIREAKSQFLRLCRPASHPLADE